ncbi:MAG TPA: hypothetical protein VG676_15545 [Chitinophagaceae bacterium]|nr:hypothetical protein [Chitinophagaceae bacterium]
MEDQPQGSEVVMFLKLLSIQKMQRSFTAPALFAGDHQMVAKHGPAFVVHRVVMIIKISGSIHCTRKYF